MKMHRNIPAITKDIAKKTLLKEDQTIANYKIANFPNMFPDPRFTKNVHLPEEKSLVVILA